ncbi:MAG TPA: membrane-bound O-acyltransferase family protein [Lachnospiraceae bacterium]|nr:membrane-bound O-acyltransferase family protein [Lachnospiraceae bacterium]
MYFNSYVFILFFLPLSVIGYFLLQKRGWRKAAAVYIIGMTLWFCGYGNPWNAVIFVLLIFMNYGFVILLRHKKNRTVAAGSGENASDTKNGSRQKKWVLTAGILLDVVILIFFKISGRLPLGISFYTFQLIAYLVDTYRAKCEDQTFFEYLQFMCFFPRFLQGPIVLQEDFIPQLRVENRSILSYDHLGRGLYSFALGLGKKVLLADSLAKIVSQGYADVAALNSTEALLVMVCYSLQLYFDFSGYCDMASGMALMFNVNLPVNFHSPYKAASISEFWDRWHITLTRFFTRYVYIPLGGSRKGTARTLLNIMIIFLLSGFWHGTNWTFLVWGALHGLCMVFERVTGYEKWKLPHVLKVAWNFVLTTFAWSIFRAESLSQAGQLWNRLFTGGIGKISGQITSVFNDTMEIRLLVRMKLLPFLSGYPGVPAVAMTVVLLIACFFMKNTAQKTEQMKWNAWKMLVTVGLLFWSVMSLADITQFLYVNF